MIPPGHSSGFAALGLQFTVCGPGAGGVGVGVGLAGHGQAERPHWGHLMPPGHSCGFDAFGSHMIGPVPCVRTRRLSASVPPSLDSRCGIRVISHSTLVRLPFVPHGGTVTTARCVMATLYHFLAFATSASVKFPSADHSVPLEVTEDVPKDHFVVVGKPGRGPKGTVGGGPGAAATPTTLHLHLNG